MIMDHDDDKDVEYESLRVTTSRGKSHQNDSRRDTRKQDLTLPRLGDQDSVNCRSVDKDHGNHD